MRFPVKVLKKGSSVPEWLERISFSHAGGIAQVGRLSVVYAKAGNYIWRPLLPGSSALLYIKAQGGSVSVYGQSPAGGRGGVLIVMKPVLGWNILGAIAGFCIGMLGR